ncbi:hypothetical protein DRH14_02565 [Candidatus Shapirobacteria bacterium]|nr:MAG: hypothetical protein DRH14_02565 [Candidatus Shapirobacteria bacterium]
MRIQLYDRGSPEGKKLFRAIEKICQSYQIEEEPEHVQDMYHVYQLGIQGETILLIDDEPILIDQFPDNKELEQILVDYIT